MIQEYLGNDQTRYTLSSGLEIDLYDYEMEELTSESLKEIKKQFDENLEEFKEECMSLFI